LIIYSEITRVHRWELRDVLGYHPQKNTQEGKRKERKKLKSYASLPRSEQVGKKAAIVEHLSQAARKSNLSR
jgi:hypothetical protein